jgi:hypothetical protein
LKPELRAPLADLLRELSRIERQRSFHFELHGFQS